MALTPAYAVDGGRVAAAMLRMVLYASTGGANGIVTPTDMQVRATPTPSSTVTVNPGSALMRNRWQGLAKDQTYAASNDAADPVEIPPNNTSSARTDYLVLQALDWHFNGGQQPADPKTALYCQWKLIATDPVATPPAYPHVPLARITVPPNTATITQSMITDLREVARPRQETHLRVQAITTPGEGERLTVTASTGEFWPDHGGHQTFDIPDWATRVQAEAEWQQAYTTAGNASGQIWIGFGDWLADQKRREIESERSSYNNPGAGDMRQLLKVSTDLYIPAKYRGRRDVPFDMLGRIVSGTGPRMDTATATAMRVTFLEVADPSTT